MIWFRIVIRITGTIALATLGSANIYGSNRTLPCIHYGDCIERTYPSYLVFEIDFQDAVEQIVRAIKQQNIIIRQPDEELDNSCREEYYKEHDTDEFHGNLRLGQKQVRSLGYAVGLGNVCFYPIEVSRKIARKWCENQNWKFLSYDGKSKVKCLIGSEA